MQKVQRREEGEQGDTPAFSYAAKSSEDPRGSIPTQLADNRDAIEREPGRFFAGEFSDEAKSAYRSSRGAGLAAAKDAAVAAAAEHGTAELWVQHSDRVARGDGIEADHFAEVWFALRRTGVKLRSVQDDANLEDAIRVVLIGERNHEDSKRKSQATRDGKRRRYERGQAVGSPTNDGYRLVDEVDDHGQVKTTRDGRVMKRREKDPAREPLIMRVLESVEGGLTFGDVARALNAEGSLTRQGKRWTTRTVRLIVTNPYYSGQIAMNGELRDGDHEPLIDRDRWERIQAGLTRLDPAAVQRRKGGRRSVEEYLLRGSAFCARCDGPMYTRRYAAGRAYLCGNVRQATGLCDAPRILAEDAEAAVLGHLHHFVDNAAGWFEGKAAEHRHDRDRLSRGVEAERARLSKLERDRALVMDNYRKHLSTGDDAKADIALGEAERVDREQAEQERTIREAESRVQEFTAAPATDAALDYFNEVAEFVRGRLGTTRGAVELRAALGELLEVVRMEVNAKGILCMDFRLHESDAVLSGHAPKTVRITRRTRAEFEAPEELLPKPSQADLDAIRQRAGQTGHQTFV